MLNLITDNEINFTKIKEIVEQKEVSTASFPVYKKENKKKRLMFFEQQDCIDLNWKLPGCKDFSRHDHATFL